MGFEGGGYVGLTRPTYDRDRNTVTRDGYPLDVDAGGTLLAAMMEGSGRPTAMPKSSRSGGDDKARVAGKGSDQKPTEGTPGAQGIGGAATGKGGKGK